MHASFSLFRVQNNTGCSVTETKQDKSNGHNTKVAGLHAAAFTLQPIPVHMSLSKRRRIATASGCDVLLLRSVDAICLRVPGKGVVEVFRTNLRAKLQLLKWRLCKNKWRASYTHIKHTCFGPPCTSVILLKVKEEYDRSSGRNGIPELVTSMMRAGCIQKGGGGVGGCT